MSLICPIFVLTLFNKKTNQGQKTLCPLFVSCLDDMLKLVFLIKDKPGTKDIMSQICLVTLFNKKTNKGQKTLCPLFVSFLDDMLKLVFLIKRQTRDKRHYVPNLSCVTF